MDYRDELEKCKELKTMLEKELQELTRIINEPPPPPPPPMPISPKKKTPPRRKSPSNVKGISKNQPGPIVTQEQLGKIQLRKVKPIVKSPPKQVNLLATTIQNRFISRQNPQIDKNLADKLKNIRRVVGSKSPEAVLVNPEPEQAQKRKVRSRSRSPVSTKVPKIKSKSPTSQSQKRKVRSRSRSPVSTKVPKIKSKSPTSPKSKK